MTITQKTEITFKHFREAAGWLAKYTVPNKAIRESLENFYNLPKCGEMEPPLNHQVCREAVKELAREYAPELLRGEHEEN